MDSLAKQNKLLNSFLSNTENLNYENLYKILQNIQLSNYILLGESTHGTEEYYLVRLIITMILVKDFGYRTIMFETEWSEGYILNLFIHSLIDIDITKLFNKTFYKFPKWMCNNEYIKDLILFLRNWNLKNKKDKVYFYGVDCQDIELAKKNVCEDDTINCRIVSQIIDNYYKMKKANSYWNMRDSFWFKIIKQLKITQKNKLVLWAHNSHIGNVSANINRGKTINIGFLLDQAFGSFKIGFSTFGGTVKAGKSWGEPGKKYFLKPGIEDSYESMFSQICKIKNTNNIIYYSNPSNSLKKFFRYVGVVYKPDTEMVSHYKKTNIDKEFNILIFFNHSNFLKRPVFDNKKKNIKLLFRRI